MTLGKIIPTYEKLKNCKAKITKIIEEQSEKNSEKTNLEELNTAANVIDDAIRVLENIAIEEKRHEDNIQ